MTRLAVGLAFALSITCWGRRYARILRADRSERYPT